MSTERPAAIACGAVALATCLGNVTSASGPASAADVLGGETIRILAIGDPVFQVMQKIHGQMENKLRADGCGKANRTALG